MSGDVVGIEGNGLSVLGFGAGPVPINEELTYRERRVGFGERRIERQGFDDAVPVFVGSVLAPRFADIGKRIARIFGDSFPEVVASLLVSFRGKLIHPVRAPQIGVIRFGVDGVNLYEQTALFGSQLDADLL